MNIKKKCINFIYPEKLKCMFCENDIPDFENEPYCNDCKKEDFFNNGKYRCKCCDVEIPGDFDYCDDCKVNKKFFSKAIVPMIYKGNVKRSILQLKCDNAKYLAEPMGKIIADRLMSENIDFDIIIPIPLSEKSFKIRTYNQSELLANEIGKRLNKPVISDVLKKIKETKKQKFLGFNDRQKNLIGAFNILNSVKIKDKNILLVDDVLTTGATTNYCSMLLLKYAKSVQVAAFARTNIKSNQSDNEIDLSLKNLIKKLFKKISKKSKK